MAPFEPPFDPPFDPPFERSAKPMSRDELLELAPLDALGLLDDFEAALFDRSFHHAPAAVQAEVSALQAEVAAMVGSLVREEPAAVLRSKVLVRIGAEVEEIAEQLKPLAHIGTPLAMHAELVAADSGSGGVVAAVSSGGKRNSDGEVGDASARSGASMTPPAMSQPASQDAAMRELVAEIRARSSFIAKDRSTPYWRAATFFLAAGLAVSVYFLGRTIRTADSVAQLATTRAISDQIAQQVPGLAAFVARGAEIHGLRAVEQKANLSATLYVDPETSRGLMIVFSGTAAQAKTFRIRAVVDNVHGEYRDLAVFDRNDQISGHGFDIPLELRGSRIELVCVDASGREIILTTA